LSKSEINTSIIITSYNSENFIDDSIKSALGQEYPGSEYELIIVDDGSQDGSMEKIKNAIQKYNTRGVACSVHEKTNGGTASARNLGADKARGEYIGFLDADDVYLPQKTRMSVDALRFGPNTGIAYSDYITAWSENDHSLTMKFPYSWDLLMHECIISTNSFVSKKALEDVGGFDETIKIIEDYDLWLRICLRGYMARHIPTHLFIYSEHENSKTNLEKAAGMKTFNTETERIKKRVLEGKYYVHHTR